MSEKVDSEGRVQIQVRLSPDEVRLLDAMKRVEDRESRASMARILIKQRMREIQADPVTGPLIAAELAEMTVT